VKNFKSRPPITDQAKSILLEASTTGESDKVLEIVKKYYFEVQTITGKMD
jgi:hypothetical protein